MSASLSGMRGGQPSTTQPIAGPWLSPKVVTRNRWPKVLNDILRLGRCGSLRPRRGQIAAKDNASIRRFLGRASRGSGSNGGAGWLGKGCGKHLHGSRLEHIDHALLDAQERRRRGGPE